VNGGGPKWIRNRGAGDAMPRLADSRRRPRRGSGSGYAGTGRERGSFLATGCGWLQLVRLERGSSQTTSPTVDLGDTSPPRGDRRRRTRVLLEELQKKGRPQGQRPDRGGQAGSEREVLSGWRGLEPGADAWCCHSAKARSVAAWQLERRGAERQPWPERDTTRTCVR